MTDREEFEKWFKAEWNADYYPTEAMYLAWQARGELDAVRNACKEALEPTVAELNDEYLRDTHVEGLSTNSKANEIIKTQHWLCLDGQMVVAQLYNLVEILNDPMKAYPHNFSTPAKGNALLFGLCQEAADEIERLKAETQEPVAWMYEDELPDNYPYDEMFRYSAVIDGVRMFPVFAPKHKSSETPLEQAEKYANGNKEIQTAYEDGFIAGTSFQLHREVEKRISHPAPSWQSLSDEEIIYMYNEPSSDAEMIEFAREFEAKLRVKNT